MGRESSDSKREMKRFPLSAFVTPKRCYDLFWNEFMRHTGDNYFFLAGGFVAACLGRDFSGRDNDPRCIYGDVDVYSRDYHDAEDTAYHAREFVSMNHKRNSPDSWRWWESIFQVEKSRGPFTLTKWALTANRSPFSHNTFFSRYKNGGWGDGVSVQFILHEHGEPQDVLSSFDFTCCAVAMDHDYLYCSDQALEDISEHKLRYNHRVGKFSPASKAGFVKRAAKYARKEYTIVDEDILLDLLSDKFELRNRIDDKASYTLQSVPIIEANKAYDIFQAFEDDLAMALYMSGLDDVDQKKAKAIRKALERKFKN